MPLIEARIGGRNDAEGAFKFLFSKIGKAISPWPDTSVPRDEKGGYGPVPPDFCYALVLSCSKTPLIILLS